MLAAEVAKIGAIANPLFEDFDDLQLLTEYRRLFSAVRAKSAAHQATWSAVRVGEHEADYMRSALEAADAHTQLINWLKITIKGILAR